MDERDQQAVNHEGTSRQGAEKDPASSASESQSLSLPELDHKQLLCNQQVLARQWVKVQPSVTAFIRAAVPQYHDAEDILQEVAAEAAVRFHEYDQNRPFLPWTLWIAKLKIADFYRTRKRQGSVLTSQTIEALAIACANAHLSLFEETEALERCLSSKLPVRARYLLSLRYEEGLKPAEIAERLKTTPGSIRVTLTRIRDTLAEHMKREMPGETNHD